jgi:hypothetical protein
MNIKTQTMTTTKINSESTTKISSEALLNVINREKNNSGADFTIKSLATGRDFTYNISRSEWKGKWYTHVSVETQYLDFKYLGSYFKGKIYRKGGIVKTNSAEAIAFILNWVEKGKFEWLDAHMDVMHTGHCLCCGRVLTDATSIERGLGPVCANR